MSPRCLMICWCFKGAPSPQTSLLTFRLALSEVFTYFLQNRSPVCPFRFVYQRERRREEIAAVLNDDGVQGGAKAKQMKASRSKELSSLRIDFWVDDRSKNGTNHENPGIGDVNRFKFNLTSASWRVGGG